MRSWFPLGCPDARGDISLEEVPETGPPTHPKAVSCIWSASHVPQPHCLALPRVLEWNVYGLEFHCDLPSDSLPLPLLMGGKQHTFIHELPCIFETWLFYVDFMKSRLYLISSWSCHTLLAGRPHSIKLQPLFDLSPIMHLRATTVLSSLLSILMLGWWPRCDDYCFIEWIIGSSTLPGFITCSHLWWLWKYNKFLS